MNHLSRLSLILATVVAPIIFVSCSKTKTEVAVCSSIHGKHKSNPNYSYEDLFVFLQKYDADIIGVEIRPEDMDSSALYLEKYYPFEMRECLSRFKDKTLFGFDWLGETIEGKPIHESYFKDLDIKKLEQELSEDSLMQLKRVDVDTLQEQKRAITNVASIAELNDGTYDSISSVFYSELQDLFAGTKYQRLTDFYQTRNDKIANTIVDVIRKNPGKKMVFILGADHRDNTVKKIKEALGSEVELFQNFGLAE